MIKEAYCSFEVSKLLKEKGFKEWCNYGYGIAVQHNGEDIDEDEEYELKSEGRGHEIEYIDGGHLYNIWCNNKKYPSLYACPTHQMAMAWLRETRHIIFVFKPNYFSGDECIYWTYERWCGGNFDGEVLSFKSYEEAVESALKYTLENLI